MEPQFVRQKSEAYSLSGCYQFLYLCSFALSTFDVISDILLVIEWYNDNSKLVLATILLIAIFLSNIVTAMTLYMAMIEIIEVIFSFFGLGSSYHLISIIGKKKYSKGSMRVYHLLSLIEVQIEASISTLLQIVHITIFNSLSQIAIFSLITSLLSIGYNYSHHFYRMLGKNPSYFSLKQLYLKLVCSLDVVSRCMSYAVCYGIFIDNNNIWKFIIAITIFILFNCTLGTYVIFKILNNLPNNISKKINISPLWLGLATATSGGFMHSIISLSWNKQENKINKWSIILYPSFEIILRFIISMISCIIYSQIGDSFTSSGNNGTAKSNYDQIMFTVCMIGCWMAFLNVIITNIFFQCKKCKESESEKLAQVVVNDDTL